jgi:hypothetical protein
MYIIEEYSTPITYDEPIQPEPYWIRYGPFFAGRSWKTRRGAQNALDRHLALSNRNPDRYRIVEAE